MSEYKPPTESEFISMSNMERSQKFLDFLVSIEEYETAQEMLNLIDEEKKKQIVLQ